MDKLKQLKRLANTRRNMHSREFECFDFIILKLSSINYMYCKLLSRDICHRATLRYMPLTCKAYQIEFNNQCPLEAGVFFDPESGYAIPSFPYKERKLHRESSMPERVCISSLQGMEFSRKRYIPPPCESFSLEREYRKLQCCEAFQNQSLCSR